MNYNLKKFNRKLQKVLRYQKFNLNLIELEIKKNLELIFIGVDEIVLVKERV